MMNWIRQLVRRNEPARFDLKRAVGRYLLEMPRCPARIVVASPRYDSMHYRGEVLADARALLPWAEHHANAVWSCRPEEQAARRALPIWLRGADPNDQGPGYPPAPFISVLDAYVQDFLTNGVAKAVCGECGHVSAVLDMRRLDERRAGFWSWWTAEWWGECGHLIHRQEHELHVHVRRTSAGETECR